MDAVFVDGKTLVLLESSGPELVRENFDLKAEALREAFVIHGYPWRAHGDRCTDPSEAILFCNLASSRYGAMHDRPS